MRVNLGAIRSSFHGKAPYDHCVIENFFDAQTASAIAAEFPALDAPIWHRYDNALERKKTLNDWNRFGPATYRALTFLNGRRFVDALSSAIGATLISDPGLHGGGLHAHGRGEKLNVHLDYAKHPKLGLERRINLIVYLNPNWRSEWGGHLGLYEQSLRNEDRSGALVSSVAPLFNRAVIFDTTQRSWHGLPAPIACPEGEARKSMAVYYLSEPVSSDTRTRALFAPSAVQEHDRSVLELIAQRADEHHAASVHRVRTA